MYDERDPHDIALVGHRMLTEPDAYLLGRESDEMQMGRLILAADPGLFNDVLIDKYRKGVKP